MTSPSRNNYKNLRLMWDMVVCLAIPAVLTGFCYVPIFRVLLNRDRDEDRNRRLVIGMFLNWLCWIICWTLYYVIMTFAAGYGDYFSLKVASDRSFMDTLRKRSLAVREHICLFFSQLNPFFYIIILKPFQLKVKQALISIFGSHDNGFGLHENDKKRKVRKAKQVSQ